MLRHSEVKAFPQILCQEVIVNGHERMASIMKGMVPQDLQVASTGQAMRKSSMEKREDENLLLTPHQLQE